MDFAQTGHWVIDLDPIALDLGFFKIRWYALAYIAGLILGWQYINMLLRTDRLWARRNWETFPREWQTAKLSFGLTVKLPRLSFGPDIRKKYDVKAPAKTSDIDDLLVWATLGVIAGGRTGYILFYALWYDHLREPLMSAPWEVFFIWKGGMSFHGGLIGVILAIIFFSRKRSLDVFRIGDLVAVATPIGLLFGRIANFINGELWGKVTSVDWGVIFMTEVELDRAHHIVKPAEAYIRHPSQLYEAFGEGLLLFTVLFVAVRWFRVLDRPGLATGLFLVGYGTARGTVEFWREAEAYIFPEHHWFTVGMLLSLPMIVIGAGFIVKALKRARPKEAHAANA